MFSDEAAIAKLAAHVQWRRLLHYSKDSRKSDIISEQFFLSPEGSVDPEAEIIAFIKGLNQKNPQAVAELKCRFPARVTWLGEQMNRVSWEVKNCKNLSTWSRLNRLEDMSLILVSGYLGNPASSFGHLLLRINTGGNRSISSLMDVGINFGANVPEGEFMPLYVLKGLMGGYKASFSDQNYYAHDQTYSQTEFRDMWEYPIELTESQSKMLVYHLYELKGQEFKYYFLTKNCAYRLAEVIQMVTQEELVDEVERWYLPIEPFLQTNKSLLGKPTYLPSFQRKLSARFSSLNGFQKEITEKIIETQALPVFQSYSLALLDAAPKLLDKTEVLDTLLVYYQFKDASNEFENNENLAKYQKEALAYRYALPVSDYEPTKVKDRISPADKSHPASLRMALGVGESQTYGMMSYSPYLASVIDYTDLSGSQLEIGNTTFGYDDQNDVYLHSFDVVNAARIQDRLQSFPGFVPISWAGAIGMRPETLTCLDCTHLYGKGGVGLAYQMKPNWLASAMTHLIWDGGIDEWILEGEFSVTQHSTLEMGTKLSVFFGSDHPEEDEYLAFSIEGRISLKPQLNLTYEANQYVSPETESRIHIGLEHRFY